MRPGKARGYGIAGWIAAAACGAMDIAIADKISE
jgi:hypothetical protein